MIEPWIFELRTIDLWFWLSDYEICYRTMLPNHEVDFELWLLNLKTTLNRNYDRVTTLNYDVDLIMTIDIENDFEPCLNYNTNHRYQLCYWIIILTVLCYRFWFTTVIELRFIENDFDTNFWSVVLDMTYFNCIWVYTFQTVLHSSFETLGMLWKYSLGLLKLTPFY